MDVEKKKKLVFLVTEDWYFCSHRLELAAACVDAGYEVYALTQVNLLANTIKDKKIRLVPITFPRSFRKPWRDLRALFEIYRAYSEIKPDIVHHVALKPVLYGSVVSIFLLHKPLVIVNAITGLGSVFISSQNRFLLLQYFLNRLLSFLLRRPYAHLIVQNSDDAELFTKEFRIKNDRLSLIRGSGVDVEEFKPSLPKIETVAPTVILVARMLKDKGIEEFVAAAEILKKRGSQARFVLVGKLDAENPSAIKESALVLWQQNGSIEWWNECSNMPDIYHQADIVVLPSYREGLPKVLLEAAACGLPIVTTDVPGCREIVKQNVNGLLVPVKNSVALAYAMEKLISMPEIRSEMGREGRKMVEKYFSSTTVIAQTLDVYRKRLYSCEQS